jgi:predicted HTH domain antitoxin
VGVKSIRLSEDIERAIRYVARREKTEQAQTLRTLARLGFEAYVARSYQRAEVTLREAAKLLGLSLWETMDRLADSGVPGNVTAAEVLGGLGHLRKGAKSGAA